MYCEDDFIMISALQHYLFCPRQCGLIHIDDVWQENLYTVRGDILHEKVDTYTYESRGNVKTVRGLKIHSFNYGLAGQCDVVEFIKTQEGVQIFPVEFKAGKPKEDFTDKVQLCAQVLCLEEMLNTTINKAAFFYGKIRRREQVEIDFYLRNYTIDIIAEVHALIKSRKVPIIEYSAKCRNCSLISYCQPKAMNQRKLKLYINQLYKK